METEEQKQEKEDEELELKSIKNITNRFSLKSEPTKGIGNWILKIIEITLLIILICIVTSILLQKGYCKTDPILCDPDGQCYIAKQEGDTARYIPIIKEGQEYTPKNITNVPTTIWMG